MRWCLAPCTMIVQSLINATCGRHMQLAATGSAWDHIWRSVQVMLRVTDLDKSIKYYTEALGMQLLKKKDNPDYKYTLAFLGYGPEEENVVFELTYNW